MEPLRRNRRLHGNAQTEQPFLEGIFGYFAAQHTNVIGKVQTCGRSAVSIGMAPLCVLPYKKIKQYQSGKPSNELPPKNLRAQAALLFALAASAPAAQAQQAAGNLNETPGLGRQLFAQSCGLCHLQAVRGTQTYGPVLTAAAGKA